VCLSGFSFSLSLVLLCLSFCEALPLCVCGKLSLPSRHPLYAKGERENLSQQRFCLSLCAHMIMPMPISSLLDAFIYACKHSLTHAATEDETKEEQDGRARCYRIQRAVLELTPTVLTSVLHQAWKQKTGQTWSPGSRCVFCDEL